MSTVLELLTDLGAWRAHLATYSPEQQQSAALGPVRMRIENCEIILARIERNPE